MAARDIVLRLLITARDQASSVLRGLVGALGRVAVGTAAIGAAVGGWVLTRLLTQAATDAEALAVQMRVLQATIDATGGAAGLTAEEVSALAERLAETTTQADDGKWRAGAIALLTFKSIAGSAYEQILLLAQSLEEAGFGTFNSNIIQLGKALENPIQGLSALGEAGVTFSDQQKQVIKALVETGQVAQAQGLVLDAVAGQVGGVAQAATGSLTQLRAAAGKLAGDLSEALGAGLLAPLTRMQGAINDFLRRLAATGAAERFGNVVGAALERVTAAGIRLLERVDVEALLASLQRLGSQGAAALEGLRSRWAAIGTAMEDAGRVGGQVVAALSVVWNGFRGSVEKVGQGIAGLTANVLEAYARMTAAAARVGLADAATADSARFAADAAKAAWADYGVAAERSFAAAGAAFARMVDTSTGAATGAAQAQQAQADVIGLTADALDAMGDAASWAAQGQTGLSTATAAGAATAKRGTTAAQAQAAALGDVAAAAEAAKKALGGMQEAERALIAAQAEAAGNGPSDDWAQVALSARDASAAIGAGDFAGAAATIQAGMETLRRAVEAGGPAALIETTRRQLSELARETERALGRGSAADAGARGDTAPATSAAQTARAQVTSALSAPIPLTFDVTAAAAAAGATVVAAIQQALAGASFSVPVTAIVTVDAGGATPTGGAADVSREAAKRGTRPL